MTTVNVKGCVASGFTPLVAVKVSPNVDPPPVVGVPLSTPVPAFDPVPGVNVTPAGRAPLPLKVGVGVPDVVTVKVPGWPTTNVALFALVMTGGDWTLSVNVWFTGPPTPLFAANVTVNDEPVPLGGVPLKTSCPVPFAATTLTHAGSPPWLSDGNGLPVAVTVKLPA